MSGISSVRARLVAVLDSTWLARAALAFALLWMAFYADRPGLPAWISWGPPVVCSLHAAVATWATGRMPAVPPTARRFWRHLTAAVLLVLIATLVHAGTVLAAPEPTQQTSPVIVGIYCAAIVVLLRGLLLFPLTRRSGTDWFTFALDAGAVVVTTAVFTWHFSARSGQGLADVTGNPVSALGVVALAFVSVFAVLKVAFAGTGGVHRRSLRTLAAAVLLGGLGGAAAGLLASRPWLNDAHLVVPVTTVLVGQAAWIQRTAESSPRVRRRPGRRFSLVPYVAVAAGDALLMTVLWGTGEAAVVGAGAVLLTVLVTTRQTAAFWENARLLAEVDRNVADLQASEDRLLYQATHDDLTDLANRALFHERVAAALATDRPHRVAVILVDLDDFKTINDRLGHGVGDALLVAVAGRLAGCVRADDLVARLGGDEFVVLLADTSRGGATRTVGRILAALSVPVSVGGHDLLVNGSMGVAVGRSGLPGVELLRHADVAMYTAKDRGKDGWAWYVADLDTRAAEDAELGAALRQGLDRSEFTLLYQPVVTLPDGAVYGVEALVRWRHPVRGMVSPAEFIPVAERSGLIVPLGWWVLREACEQAVRWQQRFGAAAPGRMNVNVSARQLREPGFTDEVAGVLASTGLDPAALVVEVTETAVFDGGAAVAALEGLALLGVAVALDDFGTGHSSLGLLRTVPVDVLKVDKSFVDGVLGSSEEAAIVTFMIQIADGLRLTTVAEGVETAAQAERLYALGYRYAQGYYFARPMPAEDLDRLIAQPIVA